MRCDLGFPGRRKRKHILSSIDCMCETPGTGWSTAYTVDMKDILVSPGWASILDDTERPAYMWHKTAARRGFWKYSKRNGEAWRLLGIQLSYFSSYFNKIPDKNQLKGGGFPLAWSSTRIHPGRENMTMGTVAASHSESIIRRRWGRAIKSQDLPPMTTLP